MNKGLWSTEAASCELSKRLESWPHAEVMRDVLVELEREEHTSGMGDVCVGEVHSPSSHPRL